MSPALFLTLVLAAGQGDAAAGPASVPSPAQAQAALAVLKDPLAGIPYKRVPAPGDVVAAVADDLGHVPPGDQPWQRYIWIRNPTRNNVAGVILCLQSLSNAVRPYSPVVLAGGALIRVDLRRLAADEDDLLRIRDIWEDFGAVNFYFNTLRDVVKQIEEKVPGKTVEQRVQVRNNYGQLIWTTKQVKQPDTTKTIEQKVRTSEFAIHTNLQNMLLVHVLTKESRAPIVRADQFVITSLTTTQGGRYYDWKNIRKSPNPGQTDLDFFLQDKFGVEVGELDRLRSEQRIAMFTSNVTSRPRRICYFNSSAVRPTVGTGLVTVTDDFRRGSIDPKLHPVKSLESKQADAHEVIGMQGNGGLIFAIYNDKKELALEVPFDIALDTTIPAPFERVLEPALSCLCCHASSEGFIKASNHVQLMHQQVFFSDVPGDQTQLRILDDEQSNRDVLETLDRLQAKFSGDAERTAFRQARNDYHRAVAAITGGVGCKEAMGELMVMRNKYRHTHLTTRDLCEELGYQVADERNAVELFNRLIPLTPANSFRIRTEDPVIAAFRVYNPIESIPVGRTDVEPVYSDIMLRLMTGRAAHASQRK